MNRQNHSLRRIIGTALVVAVASGVYLLMRSYDTRSLEVKNETETTVAPIGNPVFTWTYAISEMGEFPQTTLSLTAYYENEIVITKKIDTVDGSCNEYEERDADVYSESDMVICYYAGLGYYFKVVEQGGAYLVQRREFEEASPDYNPPVKGFETIAQF